MLFKLIPVFSFLLLVSAGISSTLAQHEKALRPRNVLSVKVVSLEGCQATPPTIKRVQETADELDLQVVIERVIVRTPDEAQKHRHIGSPTVQINGLDIDPEARKIDQFGIT